MTQILSIVRVENKSRSDCSVTTLNLDSPLVSTQYRNQVDIRQLLLPVPSTLILHPSMLMCIPVGARCGFAVPDVALRFAVAFHLFGTINVML